MQEEKKNRLCEKKLQSVQELDRHINTFTVIIFLQLIRIYYAVASPKHIFHTPVKELWTLTHSVSRPPCHLLELGSANPPTLCACAVWLLFRRDDWSVVQTFVLACAGGAWCLPRKWVLWRDLWRPRLCRARQRGSEELPRVPIPLATLRDHIVKLKVIKFFVSKHPV